MDTGTDQLLTSMQAISAKIDILERNINALSDDLYAIKKRQNIYSRIRNGRRQNEHVDHLIEYLIEEQFRGQQLTNEEIYYFIEDILIVNSGIVLGNETNSYMDSMFVKNSDGSWIKKDKKIRNNFRKKNMSTWIDLIEFRREDRFR